MVSFFMIFAGLLSAYIVSSSRIDWLNDFKLPSSFYWSTFFIVLSSFTYHLTYFFTKKNKRTLATLNLIATLIFGVLFVFMQFEGFKQFIENGHYFTGKSSNVTTSFLYVIVVVHLIHLFGGFISLFIVIYNHFKQKYSPSQTLGIELSNWYWHFMGIIWLALYLFFIFYK